jgi:hypothetical protein
MVLSRYYPVIIFIAALLAALLFQEAGPVYAKNKLDLDDLEIKGDLLNDGRLVILARERNELKNYVKFRTNFRSEMAEALPSPAPGVSP